VEIVVDGPVAAVEVALVEPVVDIAVELDVVVEVVRVDEDGELLEEVLVVVELDDDDKEEEKEEEEEEEVAEDDVLVVVIAQFRTAVNSVLLLIEICLIAVVFPVSSQRSKVQEP
jgi:hypothetical protein